MPQVQNNTVVVPAAGSMHAYLDLDLTMDSKPNGSWGDSATTIQR